MDRNFLLAISLSLVVLLVWSNFETKRREGLEPPVSPGGESVSRGDFAEPTPAATPSSPTPVPPATLSPPSVATTPMLAPPRLPEAPEERIRFETDLWKAELSSKGAGLLSWELTEYVDKSVVGDPMVELTTLDEPGRVALETPLASLGLGDLSRAGWKVENRSAYSVAFVQDFGGALVRKSYTFEPGGYDFRLRISVENGTQRTLSPTFEIRWPASRRESPDFKEQTLIAQHQGELERGRLDSLGKEGLFSMGSTPMEGTTFPRDVEWAGVELRYFLAAFVPEVPRETGAQFRPIEPATAGDVAIAYRPTEVPPGQNATREYRGYIGPKRVERLEPFGVGLENSINVGWAWMQPLTRFFSWLLQLCYAVVPNYGVAIILLTILVRLVTAPLTSKQMRSMKGMSALQPKIKEMQAKYADDRQRQSQEMMKLYKETGVNPLGGCLPLLFQFPVFIGLYYALQSSIDLRQAPFVGWIQDLSIPEELFSIPGFDIPVRVLPLIMGASMILQQRMTPSTMDPAQARMMMTVMPVMFTVLFYQFPSGLVLYWMVSNLLAIGHQVWVNRK